MLLSPGKVTQAMAEKTDKKREKDREVARTVEAKRRRLHKKMNRLSEEACCETREGTTYESGVDLNNNNPDTIEIPSYVPTPVFQKLPDGTYSFVYFDLETTGLSKCDRNLHCLYLYSNCNQDCFHFCLLVIILTGS